jgi:hypothetical protein
MITKSQVFAPSLLPLHWWRFAKLSTTIRLAGSQPVNDVRLWLGSILFG